MMSKTLFKKTYFSGKEHKTIKTSKMLQSWSPTNLKTLVYKGSNYFMPFYPSANCMMQWGNVVIKCIR